MRQVDYASRLGAVNAQGQGHVADTVTYAELAQQLIPAEDVYRRAQALITLEFTHWASGDLVEGGKVMPVIDRTCPLSETPAAFRYLVEEHARGKVVIAAALPFEIARTVL